MAHERCDACGFDGAHYNNASLLDALRALGPRWRSLLMASGLDLRQRPASQVWSALEYAAHSRDITALHVFRIEHALTLDEPSFPPIGDDLVDSPAANYNNVCVPKTRPAIVSRAFRAAQSCQPRCPPTAVSQSSPDQPAPRSATKAAKQRRC
jgi:hypothetical protein